jgi:hypothetical protein
MTQYGIFFVIDTLAPSGYITVAASNESIKSLESFLPEVSDMKKHVAIGVVVALVMSLVLVSSVGAVQLVGRPFYVFHNVNTGEAFIYVFRANGDQCGTARITGVGPPGAATLAFEKAADMIINSGSAVPGTVTPSPGPVKFSTWYVIPIGDNTICGTGGTVNPNTSGDLRSYYISIF